MKTIHHGGTEDTEKSRAKGKSATDLHESARIGLGQRKKVTADCAEHADQNRAKSKSEIQGRFCFSGWSR